MRCDARLPLLLLTLSGFVCAGCLQTTNLQSPNVMQGGEVAIAAGMTEAGTVFVPNFQGQLGVGIGAGNDVSVRGSWTPGIYTVSAQLRHEVRLSLVDRLVVSAGIDDQSISLPGASSSVNNTLTNFGLGRLDGVHGTFLRMPLSATKIWPVDRWNFFFGGKVWIARENDSDGRFGYQYGGALSGGLSFRINKTMELVLNTDVGLQSGDGGGEMPDVLLFETGGALVLHFNGPELDKRGAPITGP